MKYIFLLACLLAPFVSFSQDSDFDIKNLFYCAENMDVLNIYMLSDTSAIGIIANPEAKNDATSVSISGSTKNKEAFVKEYMDGYSVLLIERGLIKDRYDGVGRPIRLSKLKGSSFLLGSIKVSYQFSVKNHKLSMTALYVVEKPEESEVSFTDIFNKKPKKIKKAFKNVKSDNYIDRVGNQVVGYRRYSDKHKDNIKNTPRFFVYDVSANKETDINFEKNKLTDDWFTKNNGLFFFNANHSFHDGKIYFSIPTINRCYIYDTLSKQISKFDFPPLEKAKSQFYYYDHILKYEYIVRKNSEKDYEIYQKIGLSLKKIKKISFYPESIQGGKVHEVRRTKEGKKEFNCHYFVPLFEE